MYSKEQQQQLINTTRELLNLELDDVLVDPNVTNIHDQLKKAVRFHDWHYYVLSNNVISDFDYDQLFAALKAIETEHPSLVSADSPTQRVAADITKDFPQVAHLAPMLSLDNSYNEDDLKDWDRRVKELSEISDIIYCVEPKFDGASITLVYENEMLVRGATRGNGAVGEEITPNIRVLRSIPLQSSLQELGIQVMEIRGEVLISKEKFRQINEERIEEGVQVFANPRNAAAGSLRMRDASEVAKRGLEAFMYHIGYMVDDNNSNLLDEKFSTHKGNLDLLHNLGFKTPLNETKACSNIEEAIDYCRQWEAKRDNYEYEIDGMVIKVMDLKLYDKIGATSHHPRWAMAYKFKSRKAITELKNVVFQVGRTGAVTPVAKLDQVSIGGVIVSSVSLFNEDFVTDKDIRIGDKVIIERAGDVIPYIVNSVIEDRSGKERRIDFPTTCPSCEEKLVKNEEEIAWRCININCEAQQMEKLIHFASKNAMDIDGLGKAIIKRFFELNLLKTIKDIYQLNYEEILALDGFQDRSVENLKKSLEASKEQPVHRLLFGLGIRFVGETTAKMLARQVECIEDLKNWDEDQLVELEDVGPKVAKSIVEFFQQLGNLEMIEDLKHIGLNMCKREDAEGTKFVGMAFLFTGTLQGLKRDEAKRLVEEQGGNIVSSVSAKLSYLVVGESPGSKLEKAKELGSVQIISESEFLDLLK